MVTAPARREVVRWMGTRGLTRAARPGGGAHERELAALPAAAGSATRRCGRASWRWRSGTGATAPAMIYLKLRQAGELVNHKRVDGCMRLEKLHIRRRRRKKIPVADRQPLVRPDRPTRCGRWTSCSIAWPRAACSSAW